MMAGFALNVTILPDLTRGTGHLSPLTGCNGSVAIFEFIWENRIFAWILMDFYEVRLTTQGLYDGNVPQYHHGGSGQMGMMGILS